VEVFSQGHWDRIDPTIWVAPLRLEMGADAFFDLPEEEQRSLVSNNSKIGKDSGLATWTNFIGNQIEFANYRWTQFLLDFDRGSQNSLWMEIKANWGWAFVILFIGSIVLAILLKALEPKRSRQQELANIYKELFVWGAQHRLPLEKGETPFHFTSRLANDFPAFTAFIDRLNQKYDSAIYQEKGLKAPELTDLKNHWKQLRSSKI
jgi:hypothetical protein